MYEKSCGDAIQQTNDTIFANNFYTYWYQEIIKLLGHVEILVYYLLNNLRGKGLLMIDLDLI